MSDSDKDEGLYEKYDITRIGDFHGKHDDCFMFVLDINHDLHARVALEEYIDSCQRQYPQLAEDLRHALNRVTRLDTEGASDASLDQ